MRNTVTVMATDPAYAEMVKAASEALKSENLRIVVRGEHNKKDGILPIERFDLNFYIAGLMEGAIAFKGAYTAEDLRAAIANTERSAVIGNMLSILCGGGCSVDAWEYDEQSDIPIILTTRDQVSGAGVIFCDTLLRKIWQKVGDYFILPSSIYEVVVTPVSLGIDIDYLKSMVREVNKAEVTPEDQLADTVFLYDCSGLH